MLLNRKQQWIVFAVINGSLLLVLLIFPFYWKYIMNLPFNKCGLVEYLHLYCPACGGTRAFSSLLKLDILSSFKYNPIVPIGAGMFIAYEVDMIKHLILKTERELIAHPWVIYAALIIWGVYFVLRNVLLFCGIDLVGDIII
ncbi:MAG: DUF2752 domain-containing protein [Ruminococcaceae bacterium]|nr:DUF2752 domain-containing protein [Oscillospiraceae bacterium]